MKRKRRITAKLMSVIMSSAMVVSFLPTMASAATFNGTWTKVIGETSSDDISSLQDGIYTGEAVCENTYQENLWDDYSLYVSVTVEDGAVTDIEYLGCTSVDPDDDIYIGRVMNGYTEGRYDLTGVPEQIIDAQSTEEIDVVTTATYSTKAVVEAVDDALSGEPENSGIGDDGYIYVSMNIPYSVFFSTVAPGAEQAEEYSGIDTVTSATSKFGLNDDGTGKRSTSGTAKGTYNNGVCIQGVFYPVRIDADSYAELKADEAKYAEPLGEGDHYYYEVLDEEPVSYLDLTYADGGYSFDADTLSYAGAEEAEIQELTYTSMYGDYMFEILNVDNGKTNTDIGTTNIDGKAVTIAVEYLTFSDGSQIALYNVENIWMGTRYNHEISWSVVDGKGYHKIHNNAQQPLYYQYTMTDYTLTGVTVVTDLGVYEFSCDLDLLPYYGGDGEVEVAASDGDDVISVAVPDEFEDVAVSVYYSVTSGRSSTEVYVAEGAPVVNGRVSLDEAIDCGTNGTYTIVVESSNYAPVTVVLDVPMTDAQRETLEELVSTGSYLLGFVDHGTLAAHVEEAAELLEDDGAMYSEADELIGELGGYVLEAAVTYGEGRIEAAQAVISNLTQSDYTASSWEALEGALAAAKAAVESAESSDSVLSAVEALEAAIDALEEVPYSGGDSEGSGQAGGSDTDNAGAGVDDDDNADGGRDQGYTDEVEGDIGSGTEADTDADADAGIDTDADADTGIDTDTDADADAGADAGTDTTGDESGSASEVSAVKTGDIGGMLGLFMTAASSAGVAGFSFTRRRRSGKKED